MVIAKAANKPSKPSIRSQRRPKACRVWRLLGVVVAITTIPACAPADEDVSESGTTHSVSVTMPVRRDLPRYVRVTGTMYGEEETTVAAKVPGRIVEVLRDLGDSAQPSEALIRIDPRDYELALLERRHAYAETLARLGLQEMPTEAFDVSTLPTVQRAQWQSENARAKLDRGKALFEQTPPLISEQDYADLRTTWEVAQSNMSVERLAAEAILAEARTLAAQVALAEQRLADTILRAPIFIEPTGDTSSRTYEVAQRMVTVGDYVQNGDPLMRLVDSDPLKFMAQVTERRLGAVKIGQTALVSVEAFAEPFLGKVSRVSPAVDSQTRAFPVEIIVPNASRALKPGSFATANIEVGRESALMIPENALMTFAGVTKIILVRDGKAHEQRVQVGERINGEAEIRTGVSETDQVVINPTATITHGSTLTIQTALNGATP